MSDGLPNDSDGDALRRIVDHGSDLSKPMLVNFHVAVPDKTSAEALAAVAKKLGYHVSIYDSPECDSLWTCECSTRIVATYESVIAIQNELAELGDPFGGVPDGWGSFGNGPNGQPPVC